VRALGVVVVAGAALHSVGLYSGLPPFLRAPSAYAAVTQHVFVETATNRTLTIAVKPQDTVADVKAKIQGQNGVSPDRQRLMFKGRVLADGRSLSDCAIRPNDTVHLVVRFQGAARPLSHRATTPESPQAATPEPNAVTIPPGTPTGVVVPGSGMDDWLASVAAQFGNPSITFTQALASAATACSATVETKPGNSAVWAYCALPS
jgi:ubiquitin